jgi:hypothetical protein
MPKALSVRLIRFLARKQNLNAGLAIQRACVTQRNANRSHATIRLTVVSQFHVDDIWSKKRDWTADNDDIKARD